MTWAKQTALELVVFSIITFFPFRFLRLEWDDGLSSKELLELLEILRQNHVTNPMKV
jgi:hypothetical protein